MKLNQPSLLYLNPNIGYNPAFLNNGYNPLFPPLKTPSIVPYQMRQPYPTENAYFINNPTVAGMATHDNKIIFNPSWEEKATPQQKIGLYYLEASRNHMKTDDTWKGIEFTPEQEKYFKSLGDEHYSQLGDAAKKTLVSRIIAGDEIPDAPYTEQQQKIADKIWSNMTSQK